MNGDQSSSRNWLFTSLCWIQGCYWLATGLWPILHIRSFIRVTGEKTDHYPTMLEADHWLVMTVSVLIVSVALTLLVAALRQTTALEISVLGIAGAVGLIAIDIIYTGRQVIQPIYLVDAVIEVVLILGWGAALVSTSVTAREG